MVKRFWFLLADLILIAYAVYVYDLVEFFSHPKNTSFVVYEGFSHDFLRCVVLFLFLVLFVVKPAPRPADNPPLNRVWIWGLGFGIIFLSLIALVMYVNPHARFSRDVFAPITPGARAIKTNYYAQLSKSPQVVILGSSRAFTLSPAYIHERIGYEAFNMSVEGGRAGDFTVQLNFMQKSILYPRVLVVDVSPATFSRDFQNVENQPLALVSYMPFSMGVSVEESILRDTISIQSLSDSIYLLGIVANRDWARTWAFQEDGMGVRRELTHQNYVGVLKRSIQDFTNIMYCTHLDSSAIDSFENTLRLAQENNIGVVLYQSPVHPEFYQVVRDGNPRAFNACRDVLTEYFGLLSVKYPNVFYTDLFIHEPVTLMGEDGFYDAVHLRPNAAQLVVDALAPEIQKAMQWAINEGR